jgi:hypothetical protein
MKQSEIAKQIEFHDWLIWAGFISSEDEEQRNIDYYGKFADTKSAAIGAAKAIIDNTHPYRIIIQSCREFHSEQAQLDDFFQLEAV